MFIPKIKLLVCLLSFIILYGAGETSAQSPQPLPHWDVLQGHFKSIVGAGTKSMLISKTGDLQQFIVGEKIDDSELAAAVLKFTTENPSPYVMLVVTSVMENVSSPTEVARVWAKGLASDNTQTRAMAESLLGLLDQGVGGSRSFELYATILAEKPAELPTSLIKYMYRASAGQAYLTIVAATTDRKSQRYRELIFAHHMVEHAQWLIKYDFAQGRDEAIQSATHELTELSKATEWWIRLYVVQMMRQLPQLRLVEVIQKLQKDEHPLVREVAASLLPEHEKGSVDQ